MIIIPLVSSNSQVSAKGRCLCSNAPTSGHSWLSGLWVRRASPGRNLSFSAKRPVSLYRFGKQIGWICILLSQLNDTLAIVKVSLFQLSCEKQRTLILSSCFLLLVSLVNVSDMLKFVGLIVLVWISYHVKYCCNHFNYSVFSVQYSRTVQLHLSVPFFLHSLSY